MNSSEYTIGLSGTRNSSKVLKPPGGGSSNIFGTEPEKKDMAAMPGDGASNIGAVPDKDSQTPRNDMEPTSSRKMARRNPITGEGIEFIQEKPREDSSTKSGRHLTRNPILGISCEYWNVNQEVPMNIMIHHPEEAESKNMEDIVKAQKNAKKE